MDVKHGHLEDLKRVDGSSWNEALQKNVEDQMDSES